MTLEKALTDIAERLRRGTFPNEQAISQGIVLRILQELAWETWDTRVVWPEYRTTEGRADFALCHPPMKPAVFIEVKQPGMATDAVRQALLYAFHSGTPFVVLTDGRTWSFYLPTEQGSYEDRRVYLLDLYERSPSEAAEVLRRYLEHPRVTSGESLELAREEYLSRNRKAQARQAIGAIWTELVDKGDEVLIAVLADAVESSVGVRPEEDDVAEFLARLGGSTQVLTDTPRSVESRGRLIGIRNAEPLSENHRASSGRVIVCGKTFSASSAQDSMVIVLRELAQRDPTFLERCAQHRGMLGRKRSYIARSAADLYPGREDLQGYHEKLPGGWVVGTNLNNVLKRRIISTAAEVARLKLGSDIQVAW